MTLDVQQIAVFGIVAASAIGLARHIRNGIKSGQEGHCSGCGECGRPEKANLRPAPKATPLVTLSTAPPRRFKPPTPGQ